MCHRQFFRIISQNSECVKTHSFDRNSSFQFGIPKLMNNQ